MKMRSFVVFGVAVSLLFSCAQIFCAQHRNGKGNRARLPVKILQEVQRCLLGVRSTQKGLLCDRQNINRALLKSFVSNHANLLEGLWQLNLNCEERFEIAKSAHILLNMELMFEYGKNNRINILFNTIKHSTLLATYKTAQKLMENSDCNPPLKLFVWEFYPKMRNLNREFKEVVKKRGKRQQAPCRNICSNWRISDTRRNLLLNWRVQDTQANSSKISV